ncbi:XdhC family protein [Sphingobacterium pedocola]|uniref:Alanine dehydrogenase n=1 Tax=Sphingobacterium pedocola TaxID=2082722 RepID=A0ABR9T5X3_9SPHI|nr:XdhC/CoxI family protein [Sphingobacterium pedocola]MBE8720469.1 alanine dehydrogenase [Sphingobacterium pedocola]
MSELRTIIEAYRHAEQTNSKSVLATVVKVEGSSYRMPGARMLVSEFGEMTGAISGGCLEGDALRRAMLALNQQTNKLVTYDTSNENDLSIGIQLGCNGIVHILFEYIDPTNPHNPIALLEKLLDKRIASAIVTVCSLDRNAEQLGTCCVQVGGEVILKINSLISISELTNSLQQVLERKRNLRSVLERNQLIYELLLEYCLPTIQLVLVGAGNDAQPLAQMASLIGWDVCIVDGRSDHATERRFPSAKHVVVAPSDAFQRYVITDEYTAVVLMSHNYHYDKAILKQLETSTCVYIGLLGPKKRFQRMVEELQAEGVVLSKEQLSKMYGPVGLDIGAETSAEIALAITAEIKSVIQQRSLNSLRDRTEKMHQDILTI